MKEKKTRAAAPQTRRCQARRGSVASQQRRDDGGDESQARGESADPASGGVEMEIFGKQCGADEGDEVELEDEATIGPEFGARR